MSLVMSCRQCSRQEMAAAEDDAARMMPDRSFSLVVGYPATPLLLLLLPRVALISSCRHVCCSSLVATGNGSSRRGRCGADDASRETRRGGREHSFFHRRGGKGEHAVFCEYHTWNAFYPLFDTMVDAPCYCCVRDRQDYSLGTPIEEHPSSEHLGVKSGQLGMSRRTKG